MLVVLRAFEVSLPTELLSVRCGLAYYIPMVTLYKLLYIFWRLSFIYQFTNKNLKIYNFKNKPRFLL